MEAAKSLSRLKHILNRPRITNREFVQCIKTIKESPQHKHLLSQTSELFDKIGERPNHFSINTLLSVCSVSQPEAVVSVWNDIMNSNSVHRISLPLIIKCCSNIFKQSNPSSESSDIRKCIDILNHIKSYCTHPHGTKSANHLDLHSPLISGYCALSQLDVARSLFIDIPDAIKTCEHLGALMVGYTNHKQYDDALTIYQQYESLHNDVIHLIALRICKELENKEFGQQIISKLNDNSDSIQLLNSMIDFHGHFGNLHEARTLFFSINKANRDTITLNSMMKSCISNTASTQSLALYEGHAELRDDISHLLALRACINLNLLQNGRDIIDQYVMNRVDQCATELLNVVIDFYGSFGMVHEAQSIFHRISESKDSSNSNANSVALGALMKCYFQQQQYDDVLRLHREHPYLHNDAVHLFAIKACTQKGESSDFECGLQIINDHIDCIEYQHDNALLNAIIDFYGESGDVTAAKRVFSCIPKVENNIVSIGSMMKCLIQNGHSHNALELHRKVDGIHNDITNLLALKACIETKDYQYGDMMIAEYIYNRYRSGYQWVYSMELATTLIDFYGESGRLSEAENIFYSVPDESKNVIMINTMMNAYCINEAERKCIDLMKVMMKENEKSKKPQSKRFKQVEPDHVTFATALKACIQSTALHFGEKIHEYLRADEGRRWILQSLTVQICLICVYGKGGKLDLCLEILNEIKVCEPDKYRTEIALWNATMNAFGRNGELLGTLEMFESMKRETNLTPNDRTYCIVINACSHSGDVDKAKMFWEEHIAGSEGTLYRNVNTAMIDCLARRGMIEEGLEHLVQYENMSIAERQRYEKVEERHLPWMALMNGCCKHKNPVMAQRVFHEFEKRFRDHPVMAQASVLLSNTFTHTTAHQPGQTTRS